MTSLGKSQTSASAEREATGLPQTIQAILACIWADGATLSFACVFDWILHLNHTCVVCFQLSFNAFSTDSLLKMIRLVFGFSSRCSLAGCRGIPLSISLFNRLGFRGVLHKAWASTVGVGVSGVSAKFSKSSQCVSQWQHMLESLQGKSRMHKHTRNWTHRRLSVHPRTHDPAAFRTRRYISLWDALSSVVLYRTGGSFLKK